MWFSLVIVSSSASFTTRCWGWYSFTLVMLILVFFVFSLQLCDKTSVESFFVPVTHQKLSEEKKLIKTRWRSWKVPRFVWMKSQFWMKWKFYDSLNVCFHCSTFFLWASISIKTSEICTEILFHLRDFSPIFHFYRTSFAGSFCGFFLISTFRLWFFPLFCTTKWNFFSSTVRHETRNRAVKLRIYLQSRLNCMSNMTELLVSRVIKDWFAFDSHCRLLSEGCEEQQKRSENCLLVKPITNWTSAQLHLHITNRKPFSCEDGIN